ncbi:MAG TPA: hypothetical protein VNQ79_06525 [Blastocatellia bacterium]|nr:hypothetical protein [Blastocatellia bacterium]
MPQIEWPELPEGYEDQYGQIAPEVYQAAVAIWPRAYQFALYALRDPQSAHSLLLKAAADVTRARFNPPATLPPEHLASYLYTAFEHLVLKERKQRERLEPLESDSALLPESDDQNFIDEIEQKILLDQIMNRMEPEMKWIYERLILGYTYPEIAAELSRKSGKPVDPDGLRVRVFRYLEKLTQQIRSEERRLQ